MTFWWCLMCLTWQDNDQVLWKTLLAESTERNDCADRVWDATPAPVTGLQSAIPEVTQGTRLYWWHLQLRSTHLVLSNHCCSGFPHEKMDIIGKEHKKKNAEVTNTWLLKNLQEQKAGPSKRVGYTSFAQCMENKCGMYNLESWLQRYPLQELANE